MSNQQSEYAGLEAEPQPPVFLPVQRKWRYAGVALTNIEGDGLYDDELSAFYTYHADLSLYLRAELAAEREKVRELRSSQSALDCQFAGPYWEASGSHCPLDTPCARCDMEAEVRALESELTAEREASEIQANALAEAREDATNLRRVGLLAAEAIEIALCSEDGLDCSDGEPVLEQFKALGIEPFPDAVDVEAAIDAARGVK